MITHLQILHNLGVFGYQKLVLALFLLQIILFPITLFLIIVSIIMSLKKSVRIGKRVHFLTLAVTAFLVVLCIGSYTGVLSKIYLSSGYNLYLANRDAEACSYYFKALRVNSRFSLPLYELVSIYNEDGHNKPLLARIARASQNVSDPKAHALIGKLFEDQGEYGPGLRHYTIARQKEAVPAYTIGIIGCLIGLKELDKAEVETEHALANVQEREARDRLAFSSSRIYYLKGRYDQARARIEPILSPDNPNPDHWIHYGKVLKEQGLTAKAMEMFSRALSIRVELPEAYFEKGKIYYSLRDKGNAREMLLRTIYYDNQNSLAFAMLQMVLARRWVPIEKLVRDTTIGIGMDMKLNELTLQQGTPTKFAATFQGISDPKFLRVGLLEPYGFGLKGSLSDLANVNDTRHGSTLSAMVTIEGIRPSTVNLGAPWVLNIVAVDMGTGNYTSQKILANVQKKPGEEGRILFVITEDNEQTGDFPHKDDTPTIPDIDPYEINTDFVSKGLLADQIAERYGIKWSHIVDIGSSMLRLKWAQDGKHDEEWDRVWDKRLSYLKESLSMGHDVQLHIHGYSIPGNRFFRQYFNDNTKKLHFTDNIVRKKSVTGTHGAWADNFISLGGFNDPETRIGSIFRGVQLLEGIFHEAKPSYGAIFFRAGEYEFGQGEAAVGQSILALRKNNIMTDSNAYTGSVFSRDFRFFGRVGKNVYFTRSYSLRERARSLLDIGILEMLPVPKTNGQDYITPVDDWQHVKRNYTLCLENNRIRDDIFVVMEMYHLQNINAAHRWDSLDENHGDWVRLRNHFDNVRRDCPKMEPVTISEATAIYLDHYTPDLRAVRANERKLSEKLYEYEILFYGKDIDVTPQRPHYVAIKPPSYLLGQIDRIDLFHNNNRQKSWSRLQTYEDLTWIATSKAGYKINVHLRARSSGDVAG